MLINCILLFGRKRLRFEKQICLAFLQPEIQMRTVLEP